MDIEDRIKELYHQMRITNNKKIYQDEYKKLLDEKVKLKYK